MEADTSSDQRPVIQAREILAKIERGEDVEYDGVIFEATQNHLIKLALRYSVWVTS